PGSDVQPGGRWRRGRLLLVPAFDSRRPRPRPGGRILRSEGGRRHRPARGHPDPDRTPGRLLPGRVGPAGAALLCGRPGCAPGSVRAGEPGRLLPGLAPGRSPGPGDLLPDHALAVGGLRGLLRHSLRLLFGGRTELLAYVQRARGVALCLGLAPWAVDASARLPRWPDGPCAAAGRRADGGRAAGPAARALARPPAGSRGAGRLRAPALGRPGDLRPVAAAQPARGVPALAWTLLAGSVQHLARPLRLASGDAGGRRRLHLGQGLAAQTSHGFQPPLRDPALRPGIRAAARRPSTPGARSGLPGGCV